jgi:hypothetical protein
MAPFIEDQQKQLTLFNIDYFITKFEAIPADRWCEAEFTNRAGNHCALGHCGMQDSVKDIKWTVEANALKDLAPDIMSVNDYGYVDLRDEHATLWGRHPKERVVNYLKAIKEGRV